MNIDSSGGAVTSTKDRGDRDAGDGEAQPSAKKHKPQPDSKPVRTTRQQVAAPKSAGPDNPPDEPTPPAVPVSAPKPTLSVAPPPVAVVDVVVPVSVSAPVVEAVAPEPVVEVAGPSAPVRVVSGLLAGLGGSATGGDDPGVPDSPALWAVAAWTRSRMAQGQPVERTVAPEAQVLSGQTLAAAVEVAPLAAAGAGATPTVLSPVLVGRDPAAVAVFGSRAYVANQYDKTVSVINTSTNAVVATVAVGGSASAVAVSPNGSRAYVALKGSAKVAVIDTATNSVLTTIATGSGSAGVAVAPMGLGCMSPMVAGRRCR